MSRKDDPDRPATPTRGTLAVGRFAASGRGGESIDPARAWRPPTRRAFVAMLGAAAAALALREQTPIAPERPRSTWAGKTRWIGHC
jgi:hypothetical protein